MDEQASMAKALAADAKLLMPSSSRSDGDGTAAWAGIAGAEALLSAEPLLAGCNTTYIDIGSNQGKRVAMVYDVERFKRQGVYRIWFAGTPRGQICTVGFEPSPVHQPKLAQLLTRVQAPQQGGSYSQQQHWLPPRVRFLQAAISGSNGVARFMQGSRRFDPKQVAGSIMTEAMPKYANATTTSVPSVSLDWFLRTHVPRTSKVFVKLDAEGGEFSALAPAVLSGAVCAHVDGMQVETHEHLMVHDKQGRGGLAVRKQASTWRATDPRARRMDAAISLVAMQRLAGICRTEIQLLSPWE